MKPRRLFRWVLPLILLGGLVFFVRTPLFDGIRGQVIRIVAPVGSGTGHATRGIRDLLRSFGRIGSLGRTVRVLEEQNASLSARLARLEGIERENETLREQLRLLPRSRFHLVTAFVVSRTTDGVSDGLMIQRGAKDGITQGQPVIVNDGVVIGRIQDVQPSSAVVALMTDPSFHVGAETREGHAEGLVRGVRGIEVLFDTIPRTSSLHVGDRVVTSGADGLFPRDLVLGTVQSVDAPGNDIYQVARITPAVDLHGVDVVSVLLP